MILTEKFIESVQFHRILKQEREISKYFFNVKKMGKKLGQEKRTVQFLKKRKKKKKGWIL